MSDNKTTTDIIKLFEEYKDVLYATLSIITVFIFRPLKDKILKILKIEKKQDITNFNSFFKKSKRLHECGDSIIGHFQGDFFNSFDQILDMCRKQNESLVVNACSLQTINSLALDDFVNIIYKLMRDNVVELKVIFPKKGNQTSDVRNLYERIFKLTEDKLTINIVTDIRVEKR